MALLTVTLRLPDGVTDSPESRYDKEDRQYAGIRDPDKQKHHESNMKDSPQAYDGLAWNMAGHQADQDRKYGVRHAQCYHVETHVLYTNRAGYVGLKEKSFDEIQIQWKFRFFDQTNCMKFPLTLVCRCPPSWIQWISSRGLFNDFANPHSVSENPTKTYIGFWNRFCTTSSQ